MRALRRNDFSPRVEMTPLIDVVFLLLTFFIYSFVVMVRLEVLPVRFTTLAPAGQTAADGAPVTVTIDGQGQVFVGQRQVTLAELDAELAQLARGADAGRVFLAMAAQGTVDRGPVYVRVIERVRAAGLQLVIVGQPGEKEPAVAP